MKVKKQSIRTKNQKAKMKRRMRDLLNGMDKTITPDDLLERVRKRREQQRKYMRNRRADPAYSKIENEKNRIRKAQRRLNEKLRLEENEKNLERMRCKRRNGSVQKRKRKNNGKKQIKEAVNHENSAIVEEVQRTSDSEQQLNNNEN
ncbi:uncharacterized protein [Chelonus insularis]|uniref:uncharacterized protein isoform X2 n=1 Tax=Chelonus insularis TaxID=460826 RepID=UPI00158E390A|nr:uncharacterized protein LOC118064096 isoform X2 [Chelonus insularis]